MAVINKSLIYSTDKLDLTFDIMEGDGVADSNFIKVRFIPFQKYLSPAELVKVGEYLIEEAGKAARDYDENGKLKRARR